MTPASGAEGSRLNDDDLHAEGRDLVGQHLGEPLNRELGRLVGAHPGGAADAATNRGELDEHPEALAAKHRQGRPCDVHNAEEVRLDLGAEVLLAHLLDRGAIGVPGVVHDHVERAERLHRSLHGRSSGSRVGDVERRRPDAIPEFGDQSVELLGPPGRGQHAVAVLQGGSGELEPETPRAARNQPCPAHENPPK